MCSSAADWPSNGPHAKPVPTRAGRFEIFRDRKSGQHPGLVYGALRIAATRIGIHRRLSIFRSFVLKSTPHSGVTRFEVCVTRLSCYHSVKQHQRFRCQEVGVIPAKPPRSRWMAFWGYSQANRVTSFLHPSSSLVSRVLNKQEVRKTHVSIIVIVRGYGPVSGRREEL
jgi:hypothetical protein